MCNIPLDSEHEVIDGVELLGNGVLHRFDNPAGEPYSAIYVGKTELYSCPRIKEADMIKTWNDRPCFK